jgi:hypothetical protein
MLLDPLGVTFGLHPSLIIPIGAKSTSSIEKYVGAIEESYDRDKILVVAFDPLCAANSLPVWQHDRSPLLAHQRQVWVEVDLKNYRKAYLKAFENSHTDKTYVIDHIMNRKLARALGYRYVRLLHVERNVNSSSGRGGETFAMENLELGLQINPEINAGEIVYADPMDLLKMLNVKVGGFGLDAVRDNHHLFYG